MTVVEKKQRIKKIIDDIPEEILDEALQVIQEFAAKDEKRLEYLKNLLIEEKSLFESLAQ